MLIVNVIMSFLLIYFSFSAIYILTFAVAGLFYRPKQFKTASNFRKFLILVPVYKRDDVILEATIENLKQNYPNYELIIVADTLQEGTMKGLREAGAKILEIVNPERTKAFAIQNALAQLNDHYDIILILDSDNILGNPDFLQKMNNVFDAGCKVVQAHRTSKNRDSNFAVLDGLSEEINNSIFRRGHRALGLSSAIIGSGMAIEYEVFKKYFSGVGTSGEDKELEINLLDAGFKIEFLDDALVLDEKTRKIEEFVNQKKRWIANQIYQAGKTGRKIFYYLFTGNIDSLDKTIQNFLIPRIILLGSTCLFSFFTAILGSSWFLYWLAIFLIVSLTMFISIPLPLFNRMLLKASLSIPAGFVGMIFSLLNSRGANKIYDN